MDTHSDSLLEACRIIGGSQGIPIRAGDGTLQGIASSSGVRLRRIKLESDWWTHDSGPLLGTLLISGKAVALLPSSRYGYVIASPKQRQPVTLSIAQTLSSEAYVFYLSLADKQLTLSNLLLFGWQTIKRDMLTVGGYTLCRQGVELALPFLAWGIIDSRVTGGPNTLDFASLLLVVLATLVFLHLTIQTALTRIEIQLGVVQVAALYDRVLRLPASFFRTTDEALEFMRAATGFTAQVPMATLNAALRGTAIVATWTTLVLLNRTWGWLMLIALLGVSIATAVLAKTNNRLETQHLTAYQQAFQPVVQAVRGIFKIRIFGLETQVFQRWLPFHKQFQQARKNTSLLTTAIQAFYIVVLFAVLITALMTPTGMGGYAVAGLLLAYQALATALDVSKTVLNISGQLPTYQKWLLPVLRAVPETSAGGKAPYKSHGALTVTDLSFRYIPDGPLILDQVSLQVAPGEFVALVGPSGAGKSTLLRLLLGFEQYESGKIYYDDQDAADLDMRLVRKQIGVVLESSSLQAGDILANIAGFTHLPIERVWDAARVAAIESFIEALPMKLHTLLDEGAAVLSKGQRQRLLIARAVVTRPGMVFLDQALSALDDETQAQILHNLEHTTRLIIAQRASTVVHADRIYVLDKGLIIQQGTYMELASTPGYFAEWLKRQTRE